MEATNESTPVVNDADATGSKDGNTAGDNDQPYRFGRRPSVRAPYPFTERQYARLLILRGRIQASDAPDEGTLAA